MQHDRDRRAALFGRMKTAFQPTGGTVEKDLGHEDSRTTGRPASATAREPSGRTGFADAACGAGPRAYVSIELTGARLGGSLIARKAPEIARKNAVVAPERRAAVSAAPVGDLHACRDDTEPISTTTRRRRFGPRRAKPMLAAMDAAGNPSSVHAEGRAARLIVENARAEVARLCGVAPRSVTFVSGGTEAANTALNPRFGVGADGSAARAA